MAEEQVVENDDMENWNEDMIEEMIQTGPSPDFNSLVVYSRDWTVDTIYDQIKQGNIDLNPKFQRRHAWKDDKKTRLIESLITGMPVPEIVFAEHPEKRRSFIVIDGKQRLLTIAGFINPEKFEYWEKPALSGKELTVKQNLDGLTFSEMESRSVYMDELREFQNAAVRCTVVSSYQSWDVLYDIFLRLNTGSMPLSSQELRQARNKGLFADYLMEITDGFQPIHKVLKCGGPDPRLRDAEMILRFMVFVMFSNEYKGNLRKFLDAKMGYISENWKECGERVKRIYSDFNQAIKKLESVLGDGNVGRISPSGKRGGRFNKVLFEVETYYFTLLDDEIIQSKKKEFITEFEKFYEQEPAFGDSIRTSTSNPNRYETRYTLFRDFINKTFDTDIPVLPLPKT